MSPRASPNFVCLLAVLALLMIHSELVDSDCSGRSDMVFRRGCNILCVSNLKNIIRCRDYPNCLCKDPMCYPYDPEDHNGTEGGKVNCLLQTPIRCEADEYGNRICKPYDYYDLIRPEYKQYHQQQSSVDGDYPDDYEYY